jgi:hypothetical protein
VPPFPSLRSFSTPRTRSSPFHVCSSDPSARFSLFSASHRLTPDRKGIEEKRNREKPAFGEGENEGERKLGKRKKKKKRMRREEGSKKGKDEKEEEGRREKRKKGGEREKKQKEKKKEDERKR